jgi:hypothetical protein
VPHPFIGWNRSAIAGFVSRRYFCDVVETGTVLFAGGFFQTP